MNGRKILVCGGRYYPDGVVVDRVLTFLERTWGRFAGVVHGAAGKVDPESGIPWWGADVFAGFWADMHGIPNIPYPYPGEYGKAGGMIRNRWMLKRENPDAVVAFPGGNGTRNMARISLDAGVPVYALHPERPFGVVRRIRNLDELGF
jgi:hypothetical protein